MNGFETILPFLKPIEHLILDDSVSEVMVNGGDSIFIEKRGLLEKVTGVSLSERALMVAVKNIARRLGDDLSEAKPILDSRLPDGSRVAAVIPPCSLGGVTTYDPQVQPTPFQDRGSDSLSGLSTSLFANLPGRLCSRTEEHFESAAARVRVRRHFWAPLAGSYPKTNASCSSKTLLKFAWGIRIWSAWKPGKHKRDWRPWLSGTCSRPHSAIDRTARFSVSFEAERHSIYFNC